MIRNEIQQLITGESLSLEQSRSVMNSIMSGEVNHSQISALLTALRSKGETPEEVAGFALAMRDKSLKIKTIHSDAIDVCGTGGDSSGTFNISTATAFVVAGAGVKVAKHGNRSITSKAGSADVLKSLAVNIDLSQEQCTSVLDEIGISFIFAPLFHPAMVHAVPVRKELGFRTVFNILGPLTNPAGVKRQLIGVFNEAAAQLMAKAARHLEYESVNFICTENKYDEITLTGTAVVHELTGAGIKTETLTPEALGYPRISVEDIKGGSADENAEIILSILRDRKKSAFYSVVVANSALALLMAGKTNDLDECKSIAIESIESGNALKKLNELVDRSNS